MQGVWGKKITKWLRTSSKIFRNIQVLIGIESLPAVFTLHNGASVAAEEPDDGVGVDPNLAVAFLLPFFKYQLDAEMLDAVHEAFPNATLFVRAFDRRAG